MPDADGAVLASTQNEPLIEATEGRPKNVVALLVATIFATILASRQMPTLDTWLGHADVGQQVYAVLGKVYRCNCVVAFNDAHIWTRLIFILILVYSHGFGG